MFTIRKTRTHAAFTEEVPHAGFPWSRAFTALCALSVATSLAACDDGGPADTGDAGPDTTRPDTDVPDTSEPDTDDPDTADPDTDDPDPLDPETEPLSAGACRTVVPASSAPSYTELCALEDGVVQHVRIDRLVAGSGHTSAQLLLGYEEPPAASQAPVGPGQFRLMVYGFTPSLAYAYLHEASVEFDGPHDFSSASTICFDIHGGTSGAAPAILLWVDGVHGADCRDVETLTLDTVYGADFAWDGADAWIDKDLPGWFYQAGGLGSAVVTLFPTGAASCETVWRSTTDWQPLCHPRGGAAHVRLDGVRATGNNQYGYLIIAEDDEVPTGSPSAPAGSGTFNLVFGQSNTGAGVTWAIFDGQNTGQSPSVVRHTFETDDGDELYTDVAGTICADVHDGDEGARFTMWATGAGGVDCSRPTTLTHESALLSEVYDTALGATSWNWLRAYTGCPPRRSG